MPIHSGGAMKYAARMLFIALWSSFSLAAIAASLSVQVNDQTSAALSDAIVYAVPVNGKTSLKSPESAVIDQVSKRFVPLVSVIQTGAAVHFPNKDNIRHHVYSFSPAKTFELKLYSGVPAKPVVFDKPGVVIMGCNIHDSMVAYVLVVDTSWFAKTDATGAARIEGLSAGEYEVHVWHYRAVSPAGTVVGNVKMDANSDLKTSIEVKPAT